MRGKCLVRIRIYGIIGFSGFLQRAVIPNFYPVILPLSTLSFPLSFPVIPDFSPVIPALSPVIPVKAGIHRGHVPMKTGIANAVGSAASAIC